MCMYLLFSNAGLIVFAYAIFKEFGASQTLEQV